METTIRTIIDIMKKTAISFIVCVMSICVIGSFVGDEVTTISTLFQNGNITYASLFQIFSLSLIIAIINAIFDYPKFMKKILLLYKIIFRLMIVIAVTILYIYLFDWFPFTNVGAWIGFIVSFGLCFGLAFSISLYTTRKKNQEYQELLNNYKKRGHSDGSHSY
ncbi:hypothetical protein [Candidatus Stoquefichus massiliensis]|uniref:hypothetical protein n=1 Tax=Candidatus Stoquefichus massiliensis TaxID=1470350 RepID=UPI00048138DF|nr:hypothetical protein [Candidatus Stoquefichus massiliensis]